MKLNHIFINLVNTNNIIGERTATGRAIETSNSKCFFFVRLPIIN